MSTPSKDKGDRAERALVAHLQANGFPHARRTKAGGEKDLGDLSGIVDCDGDLWCVQVADRRWRGHGEIEAKAEEAAEQAQRLGAPMWCLVAKRPGCADVGGWFVWLPTWALDPVRGVPPVAKDDLCCLTVRAWLGLMGSAGERAA